MTTFAAYDQLGVTELLQYGTDVLPSDSGLEQRIANRRKPRRSWSFDVAVDLEADRRALRKALYFDPVSAWQMPVRVDSVQVLADIVGVSVAFDSSYVDWLANGQAVYVYVEGGGSAYQATILGWVGSGPSTVATLSSGPPSGSFPKQMTRIAPVETVLLTDNQAFQRSATTARASAPDVGAGRWRLTALRTGAQVVLGTGASIASFDGLPVLDRVPIADAVSDQDIEEQFQASLRRFDFGGTVTQMWSRPYADVVRGHRWQIDDAAELQYWRLFIDTAKGKQNPFLLPTWQPDLDLHVAPISGGATLVVEQDPGFAAWFATAPHKWLMLWEGDEDAPTFEYVKVTSVTSGGGLDTIHLSTTLSASAPGTFAISMMELVRFADDDFSIEHGGAESFITSHALVVQQ